MSGAIRRDEMATELFLALAIAGLLMGNFFQIKHNALVQERFDLIEAQIKKLLARAKSEL